MKTYLSWESDASFHNILERLHGKAKAKSYDVHSLCRQYFAVSNHDVQRAIPRPCSQPPSANSLRINYI